MKKKINISILAIGVITFFMFLFFGSRFFLRPTLNEINDWVKSNNGVIYIHDIDLTNKLPSEVSELSRELLGTRYVSIYFQNKYPRDFSLLKNIPNLDTFVLHTKNKKRAFSMKNLSTNLNLTDLFVNSVVTDMDYLKNLENLENLKIQCDSGNFSLFRNLNKIKLLEIVGSSKELYDLSEISNLKTLETFSLTNAKITNLDKLTPSIEFIDLSFSDFSPNELTKFTSLKQFTYLTDIEVSNFYGFCNNLLKTSPGVEIIVEPSFISREGLERLNDNELIKLINHFEKPYSPLKKLILKMCKIMAERGHPESIYKIGVAYLDGVGGFEKNKTEAIKFFRKSASLGYVRAKGHLGIYYILGDSIPQDIQKGLILLERNVVEEKHKASAKYLVFMYLNGVQFGKGVDPDIKKANFWYKKYLAIGGEKIDHNDLKHPRGFINP